MFNLIILVCSLVGIPLLIARYLDDAWLRDEQKRQLRARFEAWWLTVVDYDRVKFALVCTQAFNRFADVFFGEKLLSKKAFFRCSTIATGLLISSLAFTGLLDNKILSVAPWTSYQESCKAVSDYADYIENCGLPKNGLLERPNVTFAAIVATSNANTNTEPQSDPTAPAFISAMIVHDMDTNPDTIHGNFMMGFYFSGRVGDNTNKPELSQAQTWSNNVVAMRRGIEKYNTTSNIIVYSIAFFMLLFVANIILCFGSLVLCRKILREICAVGRVVSALALLVSNFFCLLIVSSVFLLFLLILSVPLFWLLIPVAGAVAKYSLLLFTTSVLALSFSVWILNCIPLNAITVIAFLPFFFSLFATLFSLVAMIGRNWIHPFISAVLLRCAEKSPFLVIGGGFGLITAIIVLLARAVHGNY